MRFENLRVLRAESCCRLASQHRAFARQPVQGIVKTLGFLGGGCRNCRVGLGATPRVETGPAQRDAGGQRDALQSRLGRQTTLFRYHDAPGNGLCSQ